MLNQCNFIGRLGQDPEMKYSPSGTAFCNLSIGCTEKWKDKQTQEQKERTEWVRAVASGRLAEVCGEYLRKGGLVYVSGKMQTRKWQDQDGQDRYSTEIRISEMKMLGGKSDNQQQGGYQQPQQQNNGGYQHRQPQPQQSAPQYSEPPMDFDDDIPFAPVGLPYSNMLMHCI